VPGITRLTGRLDVSFNEAFGLVGEVFTLVLDDDRRVTLTMINDNGNVAEADGHTL
jgi:hypothetical protein